MGLEKDINQAYQKWRTKQAKLANTPQQRAFNGSLFTKMDKLKDDLIKFARIFDKKFDDSETITVESINELYDSVKDDFIGKILKG